MLARGGGVASGDDRRVFFLNRVKGRKGTGRAQASEELEGRLSARSPKGKKG